MKKWLQGNDKETCLKQNEGKSVVGERFSINFLKYIWLQYPKRDILTNLAICLINTMIHIIEHSK